MINQMNQEAGVHAEAGTDANAADRRMASGQITNVEALRSMRPERTGTPRAPKFKGIMANARALEAYVERRKKLAERIRLEDPSRTEEEIEARLEQFGA
jgi:hypothetical protein